MYYSGVSQFINQLNEGLNTVVGERGSSLSGANSKNSSSKSFGIKIQMRLILDEFTNSLIQKMRILYF